MKKMSFLFLIILGQCIYAMEQPQATTSPFHSGLEHSCPLCGIVFYTAEGLLHHQECEQELRTPAVPDELTKEIGPAEMDALLDSFYSADIDDSKATPGSCTSEETESETESPIAQSSASSDDRIDTNSVMSSDSSSDSEIAPTEKTKKRKSAVTTAALARTFGKKRQRGKFICEICGKVRAASNRQRHMLTHKKKNFICPAPDCGMVFDDKEALDNHKLSHSDLKLFQCSERGCNETFRKKKELYTHFKEDHNKPCICTECDKGFRAASVLKDHLQSKQHANERQYECSVCNEEFNTLHDLHLHESNHNAKKQLKCGHCIYESNKRSDIIKHSGRMHPTMQVKIIKQCL